MALPAHHAPYAEAYRARGDWLRGAAPDHLRLHAAAGPDRVALVDRGGALTYGALDRAVDSLAAFLAARGVGRGDAVAIQLPNTAAFAVAQQAALRLGAAYVPLLPQLREHDLAYMLEIARARVLVIPDLWRGFDHRPMALSLARTVPGLDTILVAGEATAPGLVPLADVPEASFAGRPVSADALRNVLFTSGTEARPKGVKHSYNTQYYGLQRHQKLFALGPDDVIMAASPVGHVTGAVNGIEMALLIGGKVVLLDAWNPHEALDLFARERVTLMWGAATFFTDLVRAQAERPRDLSAFRLALTAGAPVPRDLIALVGDRLGATLVAAFGQSEGQNIAINRLDDPPDRIAGWDGRIHEGITYRLVDEQGGESATGRGEFVYRGPNLCLGYLDPAHEAAAFAPDGAIRSGDLAEVDAERFLRIVGRCKDIIIRGGENISPAEVEGLLFDHPALARVAVVGVADARLGQRAVAVAVAAPGMSPALADLAGWLEAKGVARFKWPERLLLLDELPMTPSGKVRKEALRALLAEEAA